MDTTKAELHELIAEPRETLDIELKAWLDLSSKEHRALVAKEIIALANHGGGYLVIGFDDKTLAPAENAPGDLNAYSQDAIQGIVAKYIDPSFQCRVVHRSASVAGQSHPIIVVPGGHRVPIRAKAGSPDEKTLVPNRIYIRRPGPTSEEPRATEEWDRLIERCVQGRQAELLEAMRSIMTGVLPGSTLVQPSRLDDLHTFEAQAVSRWDTLVSKLPTDASPRLPHGHYDLGFAIDGSINDISLLNLRDLIQREVRNHSGWPPFLTLTRAPFSPKPVNGAVEFWRGPDRDGSFDRPDHHDFWRIAPSGLLFTRRGFSEDGENKTAAPGEAFDISVWAWRVGEAVLQACYIARALGAADGELVFHGRWTGLQNRELVTFGNSNRMLFDGHIARQDEYEVTKSVAMSALPAALPEFVHSVLAPLYELFDFFHLPKRLVDEEVGRMQSRTF